MRKATVSTASLSSCLTSSFAVHIRVQSSFLLPFLYHTRTLSEPKTARWFHATNNHVNNHYRRRRTFCSTSQRQTYSDKVRRPKADPIVFVDHPDHRQRPDTLLHTEPQRHNEPSRPSTVTASEQAVFDKLLKGVSQPTTPELDHEDEIVLDEDEPISGYDPNVDLNSIFEDAIVQLQKQEENIAKGIARSLQFPPRQRAFDALISEQALSAKVFKRPKIADGTMLGNEVETEEERAKLEVACDDHRTMVMRMLDSANSDAEIWQVLEKEVFSLITHLDEHTKHVEKAEKGKALSVAKARKAEAEGKDIADVKLEKRDLKKRKMSDSNKLSHTKAIPIDNLVSILHRNYAEYCLHALRLLRRNYPTSLYAPQVFSTIKRRGPISQVLGVSTDLYNEILFLKWTQYADLHGMAETIEEMFNQGIESNEVTVALIKGISKQRRMCKGNYLGPVVKEWWAMRGVVDGWEKVHKHYRRILDELDDRAAMQAAEAEGEDGELEIDKE